MKNYHTHTYRCQHAQGKDYEYIEKAISEGFNTLGFSDHSPWPYKDFTSKIRMDVSLLDDYVKSIRNLQDEYSGRIKLHLGLECEHFPEFIPWLADIKAEKGLDYIILGNHFLGSEQYGTYIAGITDAKELFSYLDSSVKAMESGLFDYFAHPDIAFSSFTSFDENCADVSARLCEAALAYDIPLEYNLLGVRKQRAGVFKEGFGYPCDAFWEIACKYGVKVIAGLDAHCPEHIEGAFMKEALERLKAAGFNLVDSFIDREKGSNDEKS